MWRSHRRKCQLNLRSLHTAVHLLSAVTRDLQQRGGGGQHVSQLLGRVPCGTLDGVLQYKILCCALCWVQDQITGLGERVQDRAQCMQATGSGWARKHGKCAHESTDLFTLGRKHKFADVEQLGDIRNYSMGNKYSWNIVYSAHCWVLHLIACEIERYCVNHQTEMNILDFWSGAVALITLFLFHCVFSCFSFLVHILNLKTTQLLMNCLFICCCGNEIEAEESGAWKTWEQFVISKMQADRS